MFGENTHDIRMTTTKKNEITNKQNPATLKQNNASPDEEAEGLGTGRATAAANRSWGFSSPWAPEAGRGKRAAGPGPQQAAGRPPLSISVIPLAI